MKVPPRDMEKKAIPKAAAITEGVSSLKRKPPIYHLIPLSAPLKVTDRMIRTIKMTKRAGTIHLLTFSIPFLRPLTRTNPQLKMTKAVIASWRIKEVR